MKDINDTTMDACERIKTPCWEDEESYFYNEGVMAAEILPDWEDEDYYSYHMGMMAAMEDGMDEEGDDDIENDTQESNMGTILSGDTMESACTRTTSPTVKEDWSDDDDGKSSEAPSKHTRPSMRKRKRKEMAQMEEEKDKNDEDGRPVSTVTVPTSKAEGAATTSHQNCVPLLVAAYQSPPPQPIRANATTAATSTESTRIPQPKVNHFVVGIQQSLSSSSLEVDRQAKPTSSKRRRRTLGPIPQAE